MRICKKCEENEFKHIFGSVWECLNCGTRTGNQSDLEDLRKPVTKRRQVRKNRPISSYNPVSIKCKKCKSNIIILKYPEPNEFKKLQGAWKTHTCIIPSEHYL